MKKLVVFLMLGLFCIGTVNAQLQGTDGAITWSIADGILAIGGEGDMNDYQQFATPWHTHSNSISMVVVREGVTSIGNFAFSQLGSLAGVYIHAPVTSIGVEAFASCMNLSSVFLPATVVDIAQNAFLNCLLLSQVINANLTPQDIGFKNVFQNIPVGACRLLVPAGSVEQYAKADTWEDFEIIALHEIAPQVWYHIYNDDVLHIKGVGDIPTIYPYPWANQRLIFKNVEIDYGITGIGSSAFRDFLKLTYVSIPKTVTKIGDNAFAFCEELPTIFIPASVTNIGVGVFGGCYALTSIVVDVNNTAYLSFEGVLYSQDKTLISFPNGSKPTMFNIPTGTISIGERAFEYCRDVQSLSIPSTLQSIGRYAFSQSGLRQMHIPETITSIGDFAFSGCQFLTFISAGAYHTVYTSEGGVLFSKDMKTLVVFPSGKTGSYTVPEPVETIGYGAFSQNRLSSINFPSTLKTIGFLSFRLSADLTSITFPPSLTTIEPNAFNSCYRLSSLFIPASLTNISELAFHNCEQLTEITNESATPQTFSFSHASNGIFSTSIFNTCTLRVPAGSIDLYKEAAVWKEFANIVPIEETIGGAVGPLHWTFSNGKLSISGTGNMPSYNESAYPWFAYRNDITSVDFGEGVASIDKFAFLEYHETTSITVHPNNSNYSSLNGVLYSKDGKILMFYPRGKEGAFVVPESVEIIEAHSFFGCTKISSITFSASVTTIEALAFYHCISLSSLVIPSSIKTIDYLAFAHCFGLNTVIFSEGVESIGNRAFYYCTSLTSVTIPASLKSFGFEAFTNCLALTEIVNYSPTPQELTAAEIFFAVDLDACVLRVYDVSAYENAEVWKEFKNIAALDLSLTLSESVIYLLPDETTTLTATFSPDIQGVVHWESAHTNIVTVDQSGTVTAVGAGSTVITASFGGYEARCEVTVVNGSSSIEGTVHHDAPQSVTIYLFIRLPEGFEQSSLTKVRPVAGYVLLTKTIPNANGQYSFEDLPEGDYYIVVEIDGVETDPSPEFNIPEGESLTGVDISVKDNEVVVEVPQPPVVVTNTGEIFDVSLNVYPNPFSSHLQIEGAEGSLLRIFAADGRQVHAQRMTSDSETLHLEHLTAGMYIVWVGDKTVKVIRN